MNMKLFAKEAAVYAFGNVGLRAAALLLTPVYTYCLSVSDFGLWATLQITIQVLLILMSMGMRETSVRFTKESEDSRRIGDLLGTSTLIVVGGGVAATLLCLPLLPIFRSVLHREDVLGLLILTCIAGLVQALCIQLMSYYRATHRPGRYMGAGLLGALLLLVTTGVTVYQLQWGIFGALIAYILTYAILFLGVAADILPRTGIGVSPAMVRKLLGFGVPLVFSAAGQFAINGASIYLLSYYAGLESVAVYSLGWKFSTMMAIGIALPFQLAFQPFVYGNLDSPHVRLQAARLLTYLLLSTTATAYVLIAGAYILVPLVAPPAYSNAFLVALLLLPGQAFVAVHYFGETLIGAVRRTQVLGLLNTLSAALCIGFNVILIPRFGWLGAILASTVAALLVDSVVVVVGVRQFGLTRDIEWGRVAGVSAVFLVQILVAFSLRNSGALVFLGGTFLFFAGGMAALCLPVFSTRNERIALRSAANRLGAALGVRALTR